MHQEFEQEYKDWFLRNFGETKIYGDSTIIVGYNQNFIDFLISIRKQMNDKYIISFDEWLKDVSIQKILFEKTKNDSRTIKRIIK
jgi:hypothetical protein